MMDKFDPVFKNDYNDSATTDSRKVRCMEYVCEVCRERFQVKVWHCPFCDHHWPVEAQCGNCHRINAPDTHS